MADLFVRPVRNYRWLRRLSNFCKNGHEDSDIAWALKDVSFDAEPSEVVGIVARNRAGKSTLLKVLARITEPTEGYARISGRVGSLLEVGTGFHRELTDRENVPDGQLRPGRYQLTVGSRVGTEKLWKGANRKQYHGGDHEHVLAFDVSEVGFDLDLERPGIVMPPLDWDVERIGEIEWPD